VTRNSRSKDRPRAVEVLWMNYDKLWFKFFVAFIKKKQARRPHLL
jgi:hypothetical protein